MRAGDTIDGRFTIEALAGSGGMGHVYRARDARSGQPVAVKVLRHADSAGSARFAREAQVLAGLSHPRVVRYLGHGVTAAGEAYLVTEWLAGEDLAGRLRRSPLAIGEAVTVGIGVAEALAAAHRAGVVHRDVKPGNVFLVDGRVDAVKVLDFGVARGGQGAATLTDTGAILGTVGYMAPEQARCERRLDARADVFSLGCVLFRGLTGEMPFPGDDMLSVLLRLVLEPPRRLSDVRPDVPRALDDLVARMLAKDPAARPADGAAVAAELAAIEEAAGEARPSQEVPRPAVPASMTGAEQRVMCVVLARAPGAQREGSAAAAGAETDAGATPGSGEGPEARGEAAAARAAVAPYGADLSRLADGTMLVTIKGVGAFTDRAARAARAALAIHRAVAGARVVLVAGRGEVHAASPLGEVIERGVALLRREQAEGAGAVRTDEVMAGLLASGFVVRGAGEAIYLDGEQAPFELEGSEPGRAGPAAPRAPTVRTLLGRATPCVGRDRELAALLSAFEQATTEPAALVVRILGPEGAGKSRLLHELVGALGARGEPFALWAGRGDPLREGSPFGVLAPMLRRALGMLDGAPLPNRRQRLRARVAERLAGADADRVATFLGELVGTPPSDEESPLLRAAREDPVLMGDQMRLAFEDFLAAECAAQPVVVVLEDLAWGDLPSLQFLDGALRNLADRPLLVLAAARPEIDRRFPELWAGRSVTDLKLGGLSRRASERLIRETLGPDVDAAVVERIVARAGGNAAYLEELIRAVASGKGEDLPVRVLGMAQARLDELDADARRVLRVASVFGRTFWLGGVVALLRDELGAEGVRRAVAELAERELIQPRRSARFAGELELAFRQELVREAAYATLTDADRAIAHRLAGAWLERAGEIDAAALGEHFARAREPAKAMAAYRSAAEQALRGNDYGGALAWIQRAFATGAGSSDEVTALRLLALEAHDWRAEIDQAEATARTVIAEAPRASRAWFLAAAELAVASGRLGHVAQLEVISAELAALWTDRADGVQISVTARAAGTLVMVGRYALAEQLFERLVSIANRPMDPGVRACVHQALTRRGLVDNDYGSALGHLGIAARCWAEAGDLRRLCAIQDTMGHIHTLLGAYPQAIPALREAVASAERLGLSRPAVYAKHNLGYALAQVGELDEAAALQREVIAGTSQGGDTALMGFAHAYLAQILQSQGALDDAKREAARAVRYTEARPPLRAYAQATRARVHLARADAAAALRDAAEAHRTLEALGGIEEGEALIRLAYAEALSAAGHPADARAAIAAAAERLRARAARLQSPELREGFLARVPENARTLALEQAWHAG